MSRLFIFFGFGIVIGMLIILKFNFNLPSRNDSHIRQLRKKLHIKQSFVKNETKIVQYVVKKNVKVTTPVATIVATPVEKVTKIHTPSHIILTSYFTYGRDPQRKVQVKESFDYMANFYNSVNFLQLNTIIFHTDLSASFVKQYSNKNIKFLKVLPPENKKRSTNDFRFFTYSTWLNAHKESVDFVLMTDISDVFFLKNPFDYLYDKMNDNNHKHTLFLSPDIGSFHKNSWQVSKCYSEESKQWPSAGKLKMHNAGVWGGSFSTTTCLLKCITTELNKFISSSNYANCNMPAYNWCIHNAKCGDVDDDPLFVNKFRKSCKSKDHHIIHNKCKDTEGKTCIVEKEGKLILEDKKKGSICRSASFGRTVPNNNRKEEWINNHVYIDLGARNGDTLLALQSHYAKCIAFEPNPTMFKILSKNKYPNCDDTLFYKAAAWKSDGKISFYEDKRSKYQWGSSLIKRPDMKDSQRVEITVDSIDIVKTIENIDSNAIVLKIDIEGAEYELVKHLLKNPNVFQKVQFVLIEWHGRYMPKDKGKEIILENKVKQLGIKIFKKPVVESSEQHEDPFYSGILKTKKKCAIVSYISTTNFLDCIKVLSYSVKKTTKYPFIVALLDTIDKQQREYIHRTLPGVQIRSWKQVKNPNKNLINKHFKNNYAVLNMWEMVEFDRVIAIDADMLITQSIDYLCEMELPEDTVAAADIYWTSGKKWDPSGFNAGLMVLKPSIQLSRNLKNAAMSFSTSKKFLDPKRDYTATYRRWYGSSTGVNPFLNHFFNENNKWIKLNPKIWGINANSFEAHPETWKDSEIRAIHYTTKAKPCHTSPGSFITNPTNHPYRQWHSVFDEMRRGKFKDNLREIGDEKYTSKPRERVCILYLLTKNSGPTGKNYMKLISKSIASLENYFFTTVRYPVCIIHTSDVSRSELNYISKQTKSKVFTYEIEFSYPLHKMSKYNKKTPTAPKCVSSFNPNKVWNVNYLHMCHFFSSTVFYHPVFKDFDWIIRLDADSGLNLPIPCDPISVMKNTGSIFGYYKKEKQGGGCAEGLHSAIINDFLPKTNMKFNFDVKKNDVYLGAFHIFKTSEFIKPKIKKFWEWLDLKSFSYEMRTGEQAVIPYALSLITSEDKLHQFSGYGLWHRMESNKMWSDRLNIPTKCKVVKRPSALMIVAHPDDEIIWGESMITNELYEWTVVIVTDERNNRAELANKVAKKNGHHLIIWEYADCSQCIPFKIGTRETYDTSKEGNIIHDLKQLYNSRDWAIVSTHNEIGSYGHPQHKELNKLIATIVPHNKLYVFLPNKKKGTIRNSMLWKIYANDRTNLQKYYGDYISQSIPFIDFDSSTREKLQKQCEANFPWDCASFDCTFSSFDKGKKCGLQKKSKIDNKKKVSSEYEKYINTQISKLDDPKHKQNIIIFDRKKVETTLYERFLKYSQSKLIDFKKKHIVCVGARRGGEVRAFRRVGALAIGVDLNPGENNPHVLLGDAHSIGFASGSVDIIYSNVLDHILDLEEFFDQVADQLTTDGLFLIDLSKKAPDEYAVQDFRGNGKKHVLGFLKDFDIIHEQSESKPDSVWFIIAKRKKRVDNIPNTKSILIVGDNIEEVRTHAKENTKKGFFTIAMSPNCLPKDNQVLCCSNDLPPTDKILYLGNLEETCHIKKKQIEFDEWSSQPIPNKNAQCTPTNTNIHSTFATKITKNWKPCEGPTPSPLFAKKDINHVLTETSKNNIVVILIDALSRAHAMRTLPKSMKWLKENNGVSLGRYHIVGFHSEENQTPLMTGNAFKTTINKKNILPIVAKGAGYITHYASIADRVAKKCTSEMFDYWNFQRKWKFDKNNGFCNGNTQASELTFNSILDFFKAHPNVPKFSYNYFLESHWWKPVSTDGIYSTLLDDPLLTFLERLPELEHTTIIITSDHGSSFWEQRSIHPEVSYEHKLPLTIIKTPDSDKLRSNKWKLITPYDIHASIIGIMGGNTNTGTNIFKDIIPDTRTCSQSNIPNVFCLCALSKNENPSKSILDATMKYINERGHRRDSKRCLALSFKYYLEPSTRVSGGAMGEFIYKFIFQTTFDRVFEASVYEHTLAHNKKDDITIQYVKQLSQYNTMQKCFDNESNVKSNVHPEVEFCVCV